MSASYTKGTITETPAFNAVTFSPYQGNCYKCQHKDPSMQYTQSKCQGNTLGCCEQGPTPVCNQIPNTCTTNCLDNCVDNMKVDPSYCNYHRNARYVGSWGQ